MSAHLVIARSSCNLFVCRDPNYDYFSSFRGQDFGSDCTSVPVPGHY